MPDSSNPPPLTVSFGNASWVLGLPAVPVLLPLVPVGPGDDPIGRLIAAVRDFYTATGRWPLATELAGAGDSGPARGPTAASAEAGHAGLNPSTTSGAPGTAAGPDAAPGLNSTATGSEPRPDDGEKPAPKPRRRRSPR